MNALFIIAGIGVLTLVAEIVNLKRFLTAFAALGLIAALAFLPLFQNHQQSSQAFNNMLVFDGSAVAFTWLIVIVSVLWLWMSAGYLREGTHQTDKTSLVIFVVLGAVIMSSFNNMAMLFLGLEILSLSLYALAGSRKDSLSSIEAAFKYFLMGSFATGFLLFGITLVYGATRSFDLQEIFEVIGNSEGTMPGYFYAGILLMMVGLAFKISAVPFHFWAPDVYEGSPTAITSLMATVVKIAAFAAFWRIFGSTFALAGGNWTKVIVGLVILTLVIPNITAIYQQKVKRMLAYSSIAHVGYILLGFVGAMDLQSVKPLFIILYLGAYAVSSLAAFSVLMKVEANGGSFNGLYYRNPMLAVTMIFALMSMAGLPPLAGFAGKYLVFIMAMRGSHTILVLLAVATSLVSVYYYFRVIIAMFNRQSEITPVTVSLGDRAFHLLLIVLILGIGLFPSIPFLAGIIGF
ncbi:MAG TPA: NADH-quinone oxidoreductase subunit N [Cyclobacteriaceae bacterium]|nr:NADH-quinone oxidoreductase subunit N [Cyclobacteriaceae bacterium]